MDALTGWDWFVLVVTGVSMLFGLWRGLVRTVFALAAWVAAIVATPMFGGAVVLGTGMQQYPWVVFVLLFLAIFVGVRIIGNLLARGLKKAGLGGADRLLGMGLGFVRAMIVVTIAAVIAAQSGMTASDSWQQALSRPLLEQLSSWVDIDFRQRTEPVRQT